MRSPPDAGSRQPPGAAGGPGLDRTEPTYTSVEDLRLESPGARLEGRLLHALRQGDLPAELEDDAQATAHIA